MESAVASNDIETDSEYQPVMDDIIRLTHRARERRWDSVQEAKKEFADEAYPLMESIMRVVMELAERVEACEMAAGLADSVILPDLARKILATFELGGQLATRIVAEPASGAELAELAQAYLLAMEVTVAEVAEAAIEEDEDEDDDATEGE